jgi:enoyl-CoA hydratase
MTTEPFRVGRRGAVAHLTLARPEKRNAMGPAFWERLPAVFAAVDADPSVRAVVLDADGPAFTAGLDLASMLPTLPLDLVGAPPDGARQAALHALIERLQRAITAVERCRVPTIAAIHGPCIGGGVDLVTACDLRLCAADAVFGVRETRLAIVADLGTLQRLPRIVGPGHARELVFTGRDVDAAHAQAIGLVSRVLPDREALSAAAFALAEEIARQPPLTVQGAKRVLLEAERHEVERGLAFVAAFNTGHLASQDLLAAVQAMATRQPPTFQGR